MRPRYSAVLPFALVAGFLWAAALTAQEAPVVAQTAPAAQAQTDAVKGVEVLARGPVHEAFATPMTEPVPTQPVPKQPPRPIQEMPPEQKPEGDVVWIPGYWAWDDDRGDFLWVSGIWRSAPPGRTWVAGYWKDDANQWRWVPGFWAAARQSASQEISYLPAPPTAPPIAPPGSAPDTDSFYVPGSWVWDGDHYAWRAGYWARVQPGYVWVSAHYRWSPSGYVYIAGYWDLAIQHRGVLFAPVHVNPLLVGPAFVYTPAYVVPGALVVDAFFVRPCYCHYYFGDYYGPGYRSLGFESCVVYSSRCYDPVFTYVRWEHRYEPAWSSVQLNVTLARHEGRAPLPARTLVQQNITNVSNVTNVTNLTNVTNISGRSTAMRTPGLVPASQMATVTGTRTMTIDSASRGQALRQANAVQQVAVQRSQTETALPAGAPIRPRATTLNLPPAQPAGRSLAGHQPTTTMQGSSLSASPGMPIGGMQGTLRPGSQGGASHMPLSGFPPNGMQGLARPGQPPFGQPVRSYPSGAPRPFMQPSHRPDPHQGHAPQGHEHPDKP